ncbi:uncharacterized protein LOC121391659 [Gigantopelta aegis]|uniref:uncharacterized protein LOC121391659 n=1 Tax=Gigantopelta aegis TaxID=1735272 RepID=UPI001B889B17|nr:uncharacterized protein LOC121391659 [Gigantopelta aegis]
MRIAADNLTAWSEKWCVAINKDKSSTTLFTLSPKKKAGTIKIGNTPLKHADEVTYLGVTFDKKQTWKPHIQKAETKARCKLAIMRKLAGTSWGANETILKRVYQGTVRPHLEYGSSAWSTTAKTNQQALDKVQNQALRIITGSMKSTPIKDMEKTAAIQPLGERRDAKIMIQAEKFRYLPNHPMKQRMDGLTKNRLKRSSFIHQSRRLTREHQANPLPKTLPFCPTDLPQPWNDEQANVQISMSVPQLASADSQNDLVKRSLAMAMISDRYPEESWIHAYTDGSSTNAVANGGAGIFIKLPSRNTLTAKVPTGTHSSNYNAETHALIQAATMIKDAKEDCQQVVFLTDALSVLQALQGEKLPHLNEAMQEVAKERRVALQWIPAHCGIPGNEEADRLAKLGANHVQPSNNISFSEKKTLIKAANRPRTEQDDYHLLSRLEQVTLLRLRTGHNRLNAHMFRKFKLAATPTCSCGLEDQTAEHILQACPIHQDLRQAEWPIETAIHTKLYGKRGELEKTAHFILQTGLLV